MTNVDDGSKVLGIMEEMHKIAQVEIQKRMDASFYRLLRKSKIEFSARHILEHRNGSTHE